MNHFRRSLGLILPFVVLLVTCASAQAAARYASPNGVGDCSEGNPCSLKVAYDGAPGPSSVVLEPGQYGSPLVPVLNLGDDVGSQFGMTLSAMDPNQRPTIYASSTSGHVDAVRALYGAIYDTNIVVVAGAGTYNGVRADLVSRVQVTGNAIDAACVGTGTIVNAVCATSADSGAGIGASGGGGVSCSTIFQSYTYTNVTAWGSGANGKGIALDAGDCFALTAYVRNSIVHGALTDVWAFNNAVTGSDADVVLFNSNFATTQPAAAGSAITSPAEFGNQSAAAQLVNPAASNFAEQATSPTVDAGDNAVVDGITDANGGARIQGPRVDIGAFETTLAAPAIPAPTAPTLGKLKLSKKKLKAAAKGAGVQPSKNAKKKANKGLGATFTVSSTATGTIWFTLFKSTKKNGKTVLKQVKSFEKSTLAAGTNKSWFSGRWNKKKLTPGKYQLRGAPTLATGSIKKPTGNEPGTVKSQTITIVAK